MGPLPLTDRHHQYILVVTDAFTKWVEAFPLQNTTAEALTMCLVNEVVCRYGAPTVIYSDQGVNLCNEVAMCLAFSRREPQLIIHKRMGRWNGSTGQFKPFWVRPLKAIRGIGIFICHKPCWHIVLRCRSRGGSLHFV